VNNFGKNLALWIIIGLLLVALFNLFQSSTTHTPQPSLAYSEFINDVNRGEVRQVTIQTGQQGSYVYVVDSTGTAQTRSVVVERAAGAVTVVASGVRLGDRVVVSGQSRLTPGAAVTLAGADSASASGQHGHHKQ